MIYSNKIKLGGLHSGTNEFFEDFIRIKEWIIPFDLGFISTHEYTRSRAYFQNGYLWKFNEIEPLLYKYRKHFK